MNAARAIFSTLLPFTFAATAFAAEIETARGPVAIEGVPETIAVFDIAALDTLDRLGIRPAGVPDNLYLPELGHLKSSAEVAGTLFEPDLEALSALDPDLIIVGGRSSPQLDAAAQVAQAIDMTLPGADLVSEAKARISAYGTLFGKEDEAKAAAAELDAAIAEAKAAAGGKGNALILMTNGPKISAYGPGSRFSWIHSALGVEAAVEDIEAATHGEAVSFEFVRKVDPDWLIVVDRAAAIGSGDQNAKATLDNELIAGTKAWKSGQVIYLPSADVYIAAGGAQAMLRIASAITTAFSAGQ